MRYGLLFFASLMALASFLFFGGHPAEASFHCMRIDAIMAGFNGNNTIQDVELRQSSGGQNLVGGHKVRFYDATNTLKATFTFPNNATNASTGDSILLGTQEFNANTNGGDADFTFSSMNTVASNGGDALHPVQSPGGKIVYAGEAGDFNCNVGAPPADSVGYGAFTGPINFGTMPAPALPSPSDNRALRLNNFNLKPSNNATEYSLAAVATSTFAVSMANLPTDVNTPRNNTRTVLQLTVSVGGIAQLAGLAASPAQGSHSSDGAGWLTAASLAVAAVTVALGGAAWYARRRRAL
jgi:hypothetical protein